MHSVLRKPQPTKWNKATNGKGEKCELPQGAYSQRSYWKQGWARLDSHEMALGIIGLAWVSSLKNTFFSSYILGKDLLWHKSPPFFSFYFFSVMPFCVLVHVIVSPSLSLLLFSPGRSQKPRVWSGSLWNAGGLLPHLPAQHQLQSTDVSLQDWLHPGHWWQVMQKYVIGLRVCQTWTVQAVLGGLEQITWAALGESLFFTCIWCFIASKLFDLS